MKDKLLLFIIGVLVGAVISTGAFFVYTKATTTCENNKNQMQMRDGNRPSMPNGQNGEPPERPQDNNMQDSNNEQNNN